MGKPKAPKPPDPKETSQAQTGTSVGTAIANTMMGNVNQVGPDGSLTYNQTGSHAWTDPFTEKTYNIPTFTATTAMSQPQNRIYREQQQAQYRMMNTANLQSQRLRNHMGQNFLPSNLPAIAGLQGKPTAGSPRVGVPQESRFATHGGDAGLSERGADGGAIQRQIGQSGDITRSYGANDFSADRQRVEDALMERMQPHISRDREAMETRLANQGIGAGARAYSATQDDFSRSVNDARLGAVLSAGQEQQRMTGMDRDRATFENQAQGQAFGQDAARGNFANQAQMQAFGQDMANIQATNAARQAGFDNQFSATAANNQNLGQLFGQGMQRLGAQSDLRAQSLQEQIALRNQPINEITALMSGSQVSMPSFQRNQPTPIPTTDNAGLINQNFDQRMGNYNARMGAWQSGMGGLFGLGAAGITASDRRLKRDVRKVGRRDGLNIYEYRYVWDAPGTVRRGYMAQEVLRKVPQAVVHWRGWLALDYAQLPEVS